MPFAGVAREYAALRSAVDAAIRAVLASGRVVRGPSIARFERAWARFLGVEHVVLVHSGTTALAAALAAAGVRPGDEVVLPALTFAATAEAVLALGAVPVVVDVAPDTLLLDIDAALRTVGPRTRAVVPVHLYGQPHPQLERLARELRLRRVALVEDACQAHGAVAPGARCGVRGTAAAFSFYPTKNLATYGEAGAVATGDARLAARVRAWRDHGDARRGVRPGVGLNLWPGEIEAVILCVKLPYLRAWNARRRATARRYDRALAGHAALRPVANVVGTRHVYHQYVVRARDRDRWRARLAAAGIETAVHYPRALPDRPGLAGRVRMRGGCPNARAAAREVFGVPIHPWLTEAERRRVAAALAGK
ncbi:MAG: aminotransferase class I/II-fold pyridoxal phosphate-dependent enzyme [Deltaproteobacteria bacterium]|nr:aminotransferase class I/II-fold pyridoxal phosphate-dependent enzyme [Deltaproteobacteria bacterium]